MLQIPPEFQPIEKSRYPQDNDEPFEEWFLSQYDSSTINPVDRIYLSILWTGYHKNNKYGQDIDALWKLQSFINNLDRTKKYYTIVQYDDGLLVDVSFLDIKIFAMSGDRIDYPLPLICKPHSYIPENNNKELLVNFIGRNTHPIREKILAIKQEGWYISDKKHQLDTYCNIIGKSVFTLCPRGYGQTSFRIQEALQYGSIPVYISDDFIFPHNIYFKKYGVLLEENENIFVVLNRMTSDYIYELQMKGQEAYRQLYSYEANKQFILNNIKS